MKKTHFSALLFAALFSLTLVSCTEDDWYDDQPGNTTTRGGGGGSTTSGPYDPDPIDTLATKPGSGWGFISVDGEEDTVKVEEGLLPAPAVTFHFLVAENAKGTLSMQSGLTSLPKGSTSFEVVDDETKYPASNQMIIQYYDETKGMAYTGTAGTVRYEIGNASKLVEFNDVVLRAFDGSHEIRMNFSSYLQ